MRIGGCEVLAEQPSDPPAYPVRFKPLLGRAKPRRHRPTVVLETKLLRDPYGRSIRSQNPVLEQVSGPQGMERDGSDRACAVTLAARIRTGDDAEVRDALAPDPKVRNSEQLSDRIERAVGVVGLQSEFLRLPVATWAGGLEASEGRFVERRQRSRWRG